MNVCGSVICLECHFGPARGSFLAALGRHREGGARSSAAAYLATPLSCHAHLAWCWPRVLHVPGTKLFQVPRAPIPCCIRKSRITDLQKSNRNNNTCLTQFLLRIPPKSTGMATPSEQATATVVQALQALYHDPDAAAKKRANEWLEEFQHSVSEMNGELEADEVRQMHGRHVTLY